MKYPKIVEEYMDFKSIEARTNAYQKVLNTILWRMTTFPSEFPVETQVFAKEKLDRKDVKLSAKDIEYAFTFAEQCRWEWDDTLHIVNNTQRLEDLIKEMGDK